MFFLTEQDPNFRIKGSRDPLGFQTIWQSLGRNVIKYLSTVSNNLKDFQVLSYAWYFYGDRDPNHFLKFFYKFEQACGFARGEYIKDDRFNGIDFVRKNLENNSFTFSTRNQDALLSNQRSYGIFGKYNRPFTEINIKGQEDFYSVMESALRSKVDYTELERKVDKLLSEPVSTASKEDIKIFADILKNITDKEREFYKKLLLQVDGSHVQNELFDLFQNNSELYESDSFNLYSFIDALMQKDISEELEQELVEIKKSEQVLTPYVYLFKNLQSKPFWEYSQIDIEPIFNSFPKSFDHDYRKDVLQQLNINLGEKNTLISTTVVRRNIDVCKKRGNSPWIKIEDDKLMICYADGSKIFTEFNKETDFEHNYFLPSYISMYKQIMLKKI